MFDPYRLSFPREDVSIPQYQFGIEDPEKLLEYSRTVLRLGGRSLDMDELILFLAARVRAFTFEDLWFIPGAADGSLRKTLSNFTALKYVAPRKLRSNIGQMRTAYVVTRVGLERASAVSGGLIEVPGRVRMMDAAIPHRLGTAKNGFLAFTTGIPHTLKVECYIDESIRADMVLFMHPGGTKAYSKVYVETDTGAEQRKTLLGKVQKYAMKIDRARDSIFFSFFSGKKVSLPRYDPKAATEEERFSYRLGETTFSKDDLWEIDRDLVGLAGEGLNDLYSIYEYTNSELVLAFLYSVGGCKKVDGIFDDPTGLVADRAFLTRYRELSERFRNPYIMSRLNARHIALSQNTMEALAGAMLGGVKRHEPYALSILGGLRVYCVPAPLASDGLLYLYMDDTRVSSDLARALEGAFRARGRNKDVAAQERGGAYGRCVYKSQLSEPINVTNNMRLRLRNVFAFGDGTRVAAEPICFDASSWVRIYLYLHRKTDDFPIEVAFIYDNDDQKDSFLDFIGYAGLSPSAKGSLQSIRRGKAV